VSHTLKFAEGGAASVGLMEGRAGPQSLRTKEIKQKCVRMWQRIAMPLKIITALLNQATAQGSRSTVLRPLSWLAGLLIVALLTCFELKAPAR
jgi:hypothetical protein